MGGSWERGSSISRVDRAKSKARGLGVGKVKKPSSSHVPDPLPPPERIFPRGWMHDVGVFIPGRAVSGPVFICHLTSINQVPKLLEASQTVLGTNLSFNIY